MCALTRIAALLVVLVYAGAWATPCPQLLRPTAAHHGAHDPSRGAQPGAAAAMAAAVHAHAGAQSPASPALALRAPCPCGCDELPATASGARGSPLGFALCLRASELPRLPGAPRIAREPRPAPFTSIEAPEHVPIPA